MLREKVDSAMALSIGYQELTQTLEIEFRSGEIWQYRPVPPAIYIAMMNSDSIGKFFQKYIKGNFDEKRAN
jgi:hypothetical protein